MLKREQAVFPSFKAAFLVVLNHLQLNQIKVNKVLKQMYANSMSWKAEADQAGQQCQSSLHPAFTLSRHFCHLPYHTLSWLLLCSACKNPLPREGVLTQNVNLWNDVRCDRCWWNGQGRLISVTSNKLLRLSLQNHVVIMDFYHLCVSKFTEFFTLFINLELHHFTRRKDSMCVCVCFYFEYFKMRQTNCWLWHNQQIWCNSPQHCRNSPYRNAPQTTILSWFPQFFHWWTHTCRMVMPLT